MEAIAASLRQLNYGALRVYNMLNKSKAKSLSKEDIARYTVLLQQKRALSPEDHIFIFHVFHLIPFFFFSLRMGLVHRGLHDLTSLTITEAVMTLVMARLNPDKADKGKVSLKTLKENYRSLVPPIEPKGPTESKALSRWKVAAIDVTNKQLFKWKTTIAEAKAGESEEVEVQAAASAGQGAAATLGHTASTMPSGAQSQPPGATLELFWSQGDCAEVNVGEEGGDDQWLPAVIESTTRGDNVTVRMLVGYAEEDATFEVSEAFVRKIPSHGDQELASVQRDAVAPGLEARVWYARGAEYFDAVVSQVSDGGTTVLVSYSEWDLEEEVPIEYLRCIPVVEPPPPPPPENKRPRAPTLADPLTKKSTTHDERPKAASGAETHTSPAKQSFVLAAPSKVAALTPKKQTNSVSYPDAMTKAASVRKRTKFAEGEVVEHLCNSNKKESGEAKWLPARVLKCHGDNFEVITMAEQSRVDVFWTALRPLARLEGEPFDVAMSCGLVCNVWSAHQGQFQHAVVDGCEETDADTVVVSYLYTEGQEEVPIQYLRKIVVSPRKGFTSNHKEFMAVQKLKIENGDASNRLKEFLKRKAEKKLGSAAGRSKARDGITKPQRTSSTDQTLKSGSVDRPAAVVGSAVGSARAMKVALPNDKQAAKDAVRAALIKKRVNPVTFFNLANQFKAKFITKAQIAS